MGYKTESSKQTNKMKETHRQQGKGTGEDEDGKGVKYMAIKETD